MFWKRKRVYLDHAATTPMDARVLGVMEKVYNDGYWNPGSMTQEGLRARKVLKDARAGVARELSAQPNQIYFTHGGTDSLNRAILGVIQRVKKQETITKKQNKELPHVITSTIEHPAVLETIEALVEQKKCIATYVSVNEKGLIDPDDVKKALTPETVLVSIQYANNEIGTIQPIKEIAKIIRQWRKTHPDSSILFHTDAIQATNYLDLHVDRLGADLMSLSGSKIYGPKNSGILYVRNREMIEPITFGGGQEGGLVVGTEDVATAAGFAEALVIARRDFENEAKRLGELRNFLIGELIKISGITLNGVESSQRKFLNSEPDSVFESLSEPRIQKFCFEDSAARLPNNIHISVSGIESERLVLELDAQGFAVSSKSACKTDREGASHVIKAITKLTADRLLGTGNLRITLGRSTMKSDLDRFVNTFRELVDRIRKEKL